MANTTSAEYTYGTGENRNRLESVTYGNGGTVHYVYDSYDRVTKISYDGGETYRFNYGYDTLGNVTYIVDTLTSTTTFYNEDSTEVYKGSELLYYSGYDANGDLFEYEGGLYSYTTKELESTTSPITGYTTTNTQIGDEHSQANLLKTTDNFSRTHQKIIQLRDLQNTESSAFTSVVTDYTYKTYGENKEYAAGQVDTIRSYVTYGEDMSEENIIKDFVLSYEYDANGNITHEYGVDSNGTRTLRYRYTYDEANQITRVDDNIQSKTYVYQYDKGGNRVSEKIYAYTLSDTLGTVQQEIVSEYDNIVWDDLLTSYNGKEITYDNAGNPTSYDGKTFVWNGKQLRQITAADGSKTVFDYDANGLRSRKVQYDADGKLSYYVEYIWADGKIVSQYLTLMVRGTIMNEYKEFAFGPIPSKIIYDENGIPQGFTCGEATYGFARNLQGDVIAMVDMEGNIVMEYSYDPWGNIEYHLNDNIDTEEEALMITALCPLTYRGYNYDFTTGLYYLQSRYYNPEWGRFLNCDDTAILLATQGETHNANLFAYCANNPVNRVDYSGYYASSLDSSNVTFYISAFVVCFTYYDAIKTDVDCNLSSDDRYENSKKGAIRVDLTYSVGGYSFSDAIFDLYSYYSADNYSKNLKENVFYAMASIATVKFYEEFQGKYNEKCEEYNYNNFQETKRAFLFSDECVANEIEQHCLGYWWGKDKIKFLDSSVILAIGVGFNKNKIIKHCEKIDIFEQDVCKMRDAIVFGYYLGIRDEYLYTMNDPYFFPDISVVNAGTREFFVRLDWKIRKIS